MNTFDKALFGTLFVGVIVGILVAGSCAKEIEITKYKEGRANLSLTYGGPFSSLPDTIILKRGK